MPEALLSIDEVARRLGISRRQFFRLRLSLLARGLQERLVGGRKLYRESSVDRLIAAGNEATTRLC